MMAGAFCLLVAAGVYQPANSVARYKLHALCTRGPRSKQETCQQWHLWGHVLGSVSRSTCVSSIVARLLLLEFQTMWGTQGEATIMCDLD
eukprot:6469283-Amphidinium_carterae.1